MTQRSNPNYQPPQRARTSREQKPISPRMALLRLFICCSLWLISAAIGILRRMHADTVLAQRTEELAAPTVTVAPAKPGAPTDSFVFPGNVTAYTDSPIYARTDGYLHALVLRHRRQGEKRRVAGGNRYA